MQNSSNATEHADYVWKHYVKEGTPKHIAVIAHSYGGFLTVDLVSQWLCTPIFFVFFFFCGGNWYGFGDRWYLNSALFNLWSLISTWSNSEVDFFFGMPTLHLHPQSVSYTTYALNLSHSKTMGSYQHVYLTVWKQVSKPKE